MNLNEKKMKFLLVLTICQVLAQALSGDDIQSQWNQYKLTYGKVYKTEEDTFRFYIYLEKLNKIAEHNEKYLKGETSFRVGVNQFTDMMDSEVTPMRIKSMETLKKTHTPNVERRSAAPTSVDWRKKGVVTPVTNQGECGSPVLFSAISCLESINALKIGKLVSLSIQNVIDCDTHSPNEGCSGSLLDIDSIFEFIQKNGGIDTENSYPFTGQVGPCHFNKKDIGATVSGVVDVSPSGDENALKNAVAFIGPIAVEIDASQFSFQMYTGGIYDEPNCNSNSLDHAVVVVGYGTENGTDYWIAKNSWGSAWGENGYIRMSRNKNNQCGIASSASYPIV